MPVDESRGADAEPGKKAKSRKRPAATISAFGTLIFLYIL